MGASAGKHFIKIFDECDKCNKCVQRNEVLSTHGQVLFLVKLQAKACNFIKSNTPPWCFSRFLVFFTNGTKSPNKDKDT